jgi:hypothetical protein
MPNSSGLFCSPGSMKPTGILVRGALRQIVFMHVLILREKGNEDGRWMEQSGDGNCEL